MCNIQISTLSYYTDTYFLINTGSRVLVFPPVESYFRLLIHKTVEADFGNLCSFSIGEEDERRTVVCTQQAIYRAILLEQEDNIRPVPESIEKVRKNVCMSGERWDHGGWARGRGRGRGVPRHRQINERPGQSTRVSQEKQQLAGMYSDNMETDPVPLRSQKQVRSKQEMMAENRPSVTRQGTSEEVVKDDASKSRVRRGRPTMQVYVPRARRQQTTQEDVQPAPENIKEQETPPHSSDDHSRAHQPPNRPAHRSQDVHHSPKENVSDASFRNSPNRQSGCLLAEGPHSVDPLLGTDPFQNREENKDGLISKLQKSPAEHHEARRHKKKRSEGEREHSNDRSHKHKHKKHKSKERSERESDKSRDSKTRSDSKDRKKKYAKHRKHSKERSSKDDRESVADHGNESVESDDPLDYDFSVSLGKKVSSQEDIPSYLQQYEVSGTPDTEQTPPTNRACQDMEEKHSEEDDFHDAMDVIPSECSRSIKESIQNKDQNYSMHSDSYGSDEPNPSSHKPDNTDDKNADQIVKVLLDNSALETQSNSLPISQCVNDTLNDSACDRKSSNVELESKTAFEETSKSNSSEVSDEINKEDARDIGTLLKLDKVHNHDANETKEEGRDDKSADNIKTDHNSDHIVTSSHTDSVSKSSIKMTGESNEPKPEYFDPEHEPIEDQASNCEVLDKVMHTYSRSIEVEQTVTESRPDDSEQNCIETICDKHDNEGIVNQNAEQNDTNATKIQTKSEPDASDEMVKSAKSVTEPACSAETQSRESTDTVSASANAASSIETIESTTKKGLHSVTPTAKPVAMETDAPCEEEEGEDTWDALFNDEGEALDPSLMQELTIAVGKDVEVKKTQYDYYDFKPSDPDLDYAAYEHLIEIYEFPKEFITRDLIMAFKEFEDKGFDIKWVDDTHAIGVFSSTIAANSALQLRHPMIKVRPLSQAIRATKIKAKRTAEFLQPYKARPETVASVARNLVAGALGLHTNVSREVRAEERRKLKEAKERKREMRRQKQDTWDGRIGKCAMDDE